MKKLVLFILINLMIGICGVTYYASVDCSGIYKTTVDNGLSWHTPRNLTGNITDHNNCLWQIAKRLDASGDGQFFFAFGSSIANPMLDLYANITTGGTPNPTRWYVGRKPIVGIMENRSLLPQKFTLSIIPNPVSINAMVLYSLPFSDDVLFKLYSADGRLVKVFNQGRHSPGRYRFIFRTDGLTNGTYLLVFEGSKIKECKPFIVVH